MKTENRLIYIMFADDDIESLIKFYNHLLPLRQKGINIWHRGLIRPGEDVKIAKEDKLAKASIVLLLISVNFNKENNTKVQELLDKDNKLLVPIILNDYLWEETNIKHLKVLPNNGKAMKNWKNFDEACTNVAKSISDLYNEISLNGIESINKDMEFTRYWLQEQVFMKQNMANISSAKGLPLRDIAHLVFILTIWVIIVFILTPKFEDFNRSTPILNIAGTIFTIDFLFTIWTKHFMSEEARTSMRFNKYRLTYFLLYTIISIGICVSMTEGWLLLCGVLSFVLFFQVMFSSM